MKRWLGFICLKIFPCYVVSEPGVRDLTGFLSVPHKICLRSGLLLSLRPAELLSFKYVFTLSD